MARMQRNSRVTVVNGDAWAVGATGTVLSLLGDDSFLVRLDEPRLDDLGDGPFSVVQFAASNLRLTSGEVQPDNLALDELYRQARVEVDADRRFAVERAAARTMVEEALRGGHPASIRALLIDYRDRVLPLHPRKGTTGWGAALCGFGYSLYQSGERLRDPGLLVQAEDVLKEALIHETSQLDTGHVQILYYLALTRNALGVIQTRAADFDSAISAIETALNLNPRMFLDQINVALGQAHLGLARTGGGVSSAEMALQVFERVPITRTSSGLFWAHQCIAIAEANLVGQSWTSMSLADARKSVNGALSYYRSRQREHWFMPHWMEHAEAVRERVRAVKLP